MIKGSNDQEHTTITNVYAPKNKQGFKTYETKIYKIKGKIR